MRKTIFLSMTVAVAALAAFLILPKFANTDSSPAVALTGQVSSQKEGLMEGVVVGAKKDGSTVTIDVFSDAKGRYSFPAAKLEPGHYLVLEDGAVRAGLDHGLEHQPGLLRQREPREQVVHPLVDAEPRVLERVHPAVLVEVAELHALGTGQLDRFHHCLSIVLTSAPPVAALRPALPRTPPCR